MKEHITEDSAKRLIEWFVANETILRNAASGTTTFDQWSQNMSLWTFDTIVRTLVQHKLCLEPAPTIRPYNRDECEALVTVRNKVSRDVYAIQSVKSWANRPFCVEIDKTYYTAWELFQTFEHLDGSPCGVKEGSES